MTGPLPGPEAGAVVYTVKELLGRIDVKVDHLVEKLDSKADEAKVDKLAEQVATLQNEAASRASVETYKRWLYSFAAFGFLNLAFAVFAFVKSL